MGTTSLSPNFDADDTPSGVRYRLRPSRAYQPGFPLIVGCVAAVPAAAAALAVAFLVAYFPAVSWTLLALSGLFVIQMLFVARLPGRMAWQGLVTSFGYGEIELRG